MTAKITLKEDTAPSTPSSGYIAVYAKSDGRLYYKDDAGVEHPVATDENMIALIAALG